MRRPPRFRFRPAVPNTHTHTDPSKSLAVCLQLSGKKVGPFFHKLFHANDRVAAPGWRFQALSLMISTDAALLYLCAL